MKEEPEPAFVAETLAWCNGHRKRKGLRALSKMPKGYRDDETSCPCGKAAKIVVGTDYWYEDEEDTSPKPLPTPVVRFVAFFDHERLPQYDASIKKKKA